ncbi:UTRA domain-containing protein [Seinonella peptonophila]|uniref:UTRA domain-containing protein n=1 Tax=Seinonella peptonophila TaxID=112248 RepID=UPI001587D157|nr:UTRA domain-containing protein [Seinonella peptonophila]
MHAVSRSYIPDQIPLEELLKLLKEPGASLYKTLEKLEHTPTTCQESLIADVPSKQENKELHLVENSNIPVIKIERKVFDQKQQLIEVYHLICRADCYQFEYKFHL